MERIFVIAYFMDIEWPLTEFLFFKKIVVKLFTVT